MSIEQAASQLSSDTSADPTLASLQYIASFIEASRHRFPKSIKHRDTFQLNVARAAVGKLIHERQQAIAKHA